MKRLQCLYKPSYNREYPWTLKHPKVNQPLALFKSRKDAINWFLSKGLECATWFQTEDKIWGGLLVAEKVPHGFDYELNVDKFDGGLDLRKTAEELYIFERSGQRDRKNAEEYLKTITDFKPVWSNMDDIEPYFPKDDDWTAPKKSKKDLEIESLKAQLQALLQEIAKTSNRYNNEIDALMARLNDEKEDKSQLLSEIQALKERSLEEQKQEVEKVVIQEVIREVPVEKIVYKDCEKCKNGVCSKGESKITEFSYIGDFPLYKQVEILALYAHKLQVLNEQLPDTTYVSQEEFLRIKANWVEVVRYTLNLEEKLENESDYTKRVYKLGAQVLNFEIDVLLEKVKSKSSQEFKLESATYVEDEQQRLRTTLIQASSFVDYKHYQVAFVPKSEYDHAIFKHDSYNESKELVVWKIEEKVVETKEFKSPEEKQSSLFRKLGLFLVLSGYAILLIALIVLVCLLSL
ncbi:coiled-coil domain-containing protein [Mycoplasmopsis sturni]|uniref:coiled-coil domain-containing protein n=1 Tax=Mycoplasmopsis sturni TaxID=39047 RepID=UPI00056B8EE5|nr:hypothetical protein [Mycoplasmopsis sturni]